MMALNRPEPPTMGGVAAFLAMNRTTLTAAHKPLERRGSIKVAVDSRAGGKGRMMLTPAGRALLAEAMPVWEQTHAKLDHMLPHGSTDHLRRNLRALS